ncbi:MAG: arsenate reductase (glutaredoxin) [Gammaproteobacteria bacterium]|nr:arsenate reductase (glutaredoxin) [Gammaproteobacteria bacterium]MBU1554247.1 arsenate reductase (glutaredoxin) [Gammaproteobacteria bacterium]MBU2070191.1 arsenate reductase (glutaredoxin) [Gammaproteobacteria bacterium]MBU2183558.1 arsenate reductase (glutaredoxin) [Gammaproteobacteria bacterium]MBU2204709.1 arsenate reductase (glutaredoxin) [Gammaproteobacteria bacterium]
MLKIYHNPRCSKSRETLALLSEHSSAIEVIDYLKTPPTEQELRQLLSLLGISARQLLRSKEPEYAALGLDNTALTEQQLITAMLNTPKLIERPIVVNGNKAAIGRPASNVLAIL